jgi:hypothetical protein
MNCKQSTEVFLMDNLYHCVLRERNVEVYSGRLANLLQVGFGSIGS